MLHWNQNWTQQRPPTASGTCSRSRWVECHLLHVGQEEEVTKALKAGTVVGEITPLLSVICLAMKAQPRCKSSRLGL